MKYTPYIIFLFLISQVKAQLPEDALRMGWTVPSGTARNQAIGGAMGSLGGEITSIFVNPAGLAFYKTSEIVLSPGINLLKSNNTYRDTKASSDVLSRFNLGTTGFVTGTNDRYSKWTSKAFGIAVNKVANFNSSIYYKGNNNHSSFSESFAEEFSRSGVSIDPDAYFNSNLSLGTKMALETFLIDTMTLNGQTQVIGLPEFLNSVNQENTITTKGGITEIAIGFASNMDDKIYIGGSIGVPIVNYQRQTVYTETDPDNDPDNNFHSARFEENYSTKGIGVNAKLGLIFKPHSSWRVGLAMHTPTLYGLKDKLTGSMVTDVEKYLGANDPYQGKYNTSSDYFFNNQPATFKYDLVSPWKFLVSGSYVLSEVEDVTKQKGFITADIEYVTTRSSRYSASDEGDDSYFEDVNEAIKSAYKGTFNFRVGGELKFNTLMTRLGFAYYGNPYKDDELKGRKMNISGGLGYRNKGIFIDLTYVHSINKDVHFPYRLTDKANTFANLKESNGNILLTFGFKI